MSVGKDSACVSARVVCCRYNHKDKPRLEDKSTNCIVERLKYQSDFTSKNISEEVTSTTNCQLHGGRKSIFEIEHRPRGPRTLAG